MKFSINQANLKRAAWHVFWIAAGAAVGAILDLVAKSSNPDVVAVGGLLGNIVASFIRWEQQDN